MESNVFDTAMLVLRVAVGAVMLAHGVKHARGREKTTNWFASIGYRQPGLQWLASTATEIGVGVLLIAGALTSPAAAGVAGILTVAFLTVHRKAGFWITARPDEGWEYVFILIVTAFVIAVFGGGEYSIDAAADIADLLDGWVGAALVGAAIVLGVSQVAVFFRPGEAETD